MIRLNANRGIAGSGLFAGRSFQINEFMPGACCFRRQITLVVGIDRGLERNAGGDINAGCETIELGRIVGKQRSACNPGFAASRRNAIARSSSSNPASCSIARIEPAVLQSIGSHLVRQADAAAFLGEVQNDTAAEAFQAASASRSWSPQSHRREPKTSPVRHAE